MTLSICLRQGPRKGRFLLSEVPLYGIDYGRGPRPGVAVGAAHPWAGGGGGRETEATERGERETAGATRPSSERERGAYSLSLPACPQPQTAGYERIWIML